MDQTVLQDITKSNSSRMSDHHDLDTKIEPNVRIQPIEMLFEY